ncbi:MAG: threonine--tRNA ligase [Clostridia bacterium]|nr:threonine--tRNA ligase [Clostridia bacterium]
MLNEEGAELLKKVIIKKYGKVELEKISADENEFNFDFKINENIGENDLTDLEKELKKESNLYIKLIRISGVYVDGNIENEMINRISGKVFSSNEELKKYEEFLEDAKERNHKKIGKDLDLFCFSDFLGAGLPLYTPRGTIVKDELQKQIEKICRKYGFQKVSCPSLANISLFETSGHAQKFNDELFRVSSPKGHEFVLKPVQCPHHTQIYSSKIRSYRDLPIRYMESDKQYRAELQGSVGGLSRVYAITVEDGHSFCRIDQVKDEIINMYNIIRDFYSKMGLWNNYWVSLSLRDSKHPEKYIGSNEDWQLSENILKDICNELNLDAKVCEGEAALYGPKIDFMFKDALGREIQIPTIQLDFATPKRFGLFYIDESGEKQIPVMIHRAILGSYERFLVLLLEQFKGVLPIWLSPVQVNIIPVNNNAHSDYCKKLMEKLLDEDIRVEMDMSSETLNKKIKVSNDMKNPYTVVIGNNEIENNSVCFRKLGSKEQNIMDIDDFVQMLKKQIQQDKNI